MIVQSVGQHVRGFGWVYVYTYYMKLMLNITSMRIRRTSFITHLMNVIVVHKKIFLLLDVYMFVCMYVCIHIYNAFTIIH